MKGCVFSYIYDIPGVDGEVVNDMPREFRQHDVPDVYNVEAINAQVRGDRPDVPVYSFLTWTR